MNPAPDAHLMNAARQATHVLFSPIRDELAAFDEEFSRCLNSNVQIVAEIGRYLNDGRGKRIRPALLLLAAKLWGRAVTASVIRMAVVVEFIHTATLVHDDIIDDAEIRRGRPSVNARWGNQITVLMGDWLYMLAFEMALEERSFEILDPMTRSTRAMTEGELMQRTHVGNLAITREQYFAILQRKTAHLFSACAEIGGIMGGATRDEQDALRRYAMNLGTAFQLVDDVLDFTSSDTVLGKPAGSDLCEGKLTLPLIYLLQTDSGYVELVNTIVQDGDYRTVKREQLLALLEAHGTLERTRDEAQRYALEACSCIRGLPSSRYRELLLDIARLTVERTS